MAEDDDTKALELALAETNAGEPQPSSVPPELDDTLAPEALDTLAPGPLGDVLGSPEIRRARDLARQKLFGTPDAPVRIDRFVILDRLGGGGMGVVYAAYDPQLDRKVALKLLRPGWDPSSSQEMKQRLVGEAQAMARVKHPCVITVHDVGVHEGQVFVAMEFVEGRTLSAWLEEARRSWKEIRHVFLEIGRGLAAAHAAGLVHRDFKPDNVMIADDDRVVVLDFGLAKAVAARAQEPTRHDDPPEPTVASVDRALGLSMTRTGTLVGTPAYMAPEQHRGDAVDAKADQFAFCLALFEAVYGRRPFAGATYDELARVVCAGEMELPAERGQMPARAYGAMLRGLEADPTARFPDMDAFLAELAHDPAVTRRRWVGITVAALAIAGALFSGQAIERSDSPCRRAVERHERAWNDGVRGRAEAAFLGTDKPYAAEAWSSVERMLLRYGGSWQEAHEQVCGDGSDEDEQRSRLACLDARTLELETLVSLFVRADGEVVERATEAADALTTPRACTRADPATIAVLLPKDDEALRTEVLRARAALAHAKGLGDAGKYENAIAIAEDVLASDPAKRFGPLRAEAALRTGGLLRETSSLDAATAALSEAVYVGLGEGHDEAALHAATELVWLTGWERATFEQALPWMQLAEALLRRRGGAADADRLDLATGAMFLAAGRHQEAQRYFGRPLERSEMLDPLEPSLWLARSLVAEGALDEALETSRRALARLEDQHDAHHPALARIHVHLGDLQWKRGRYDEAKHHFEEALAIETRARGEAHPAIAPALAGLARTAWASSARTETARHLDRLFTLSKTERVDRATLVAALEVQGHLHTEAKRYVEARDAIGRGMALARRQGSDHPLLAFLFYAQGELHLEQGRIDEARRDLETAHALVGADIGVSDPRRQEIAIARARASIEAGDASEAVVLLQDARRILSTCCDGHFRLPDAELALARALLAIETDPTRVVPLLESATRRFAEHGREDGVEQARARLARLRQDNP